ncbi:MAG: flippase-like domain-containing protein [Candidatus Rokubacteria bacterium]|nr:flippase-like domain-containing protein [Candidatus Rokubacteria bacterium]
MQLAQTHWGWVAASIACALAGLWIRAQRWYYLFPPGSNPPGLLAGIMIGYMANNVLPLRAGEALRVYVVARRWRARGNASQGFWTTLATLVVERVLDGLAVVLILSTLLFFVSVPPVFAWAALALLSVDLCGMGVLFALAVAPERCRRLLMRLARRWPRIEQRGLVIFERFAAGLAGIRCPAHAVPLLLWSIAVWVVAMLAAWTALLAVNLHLPMLAGWTVLAFVGLGVSIPSAPGYIGVFHAAAAWALRIFAVPETTAVGYAILLHASQIIPITLIGWIFLLREHVSLTDASRTRTIGETP